MQKKLTLLIFLFPFLLAAQATYKNGTITFDFGKKKKQQDSIQQQQQSTSDDDDNEDSVKARKARKREAAKVKEQQGERPDYAKNGLFQAIFHGGINACQVDNDGDIDPGFTYPGAEFGIGTMIKVHKIISVSMEINYSMKGEKQVFSFDSTTIANSRQQYQVSWDYIEVPLAANIFTFPSHGQNLSFFNLGLAPAVMVRFKEIDQDGENVTSNPPEGIPRRFELSCFAGLYFVIAKNYAIGARFEYGFTKVRGVVLYGTPRLLGDHNILLNLDFMYMMNTVKKKK